MRHVVSTVVLAALVTVASLTGCGGDREERGLAPASEPSSPTSAKELDMSAQQRQAQSAQELQAKSDQEFDAAQAAAEKAAKEAAEAAAKQAP